MKIFYQYANRKELTPTRGDFITELYIIKAISKFATISCDESKNDYDLYYVRNNPGLFLKLPHPKIYFATPFHEKAYGEADVIATFTDTWSQRMRDGILIETIGISPNRNIITIHQVVDSIFKPLQSHPRTKRIRQKIGGDFIIGHFGAVRESNYPYSFLHILPKLKKIYPGLKVVFGGGTLKKENENIAYTNYDYSDMPYAISACDLILYNFRIHAGHFVGSLKILEAMACGVPILSPEFEARIDALGKKYELFYPFKINKGRYSCKIEKIMFKKICRTIKDEKLRKKISRRLIKRSKFYSIDESAKRLEKTFKELL